MCPKWSFIGSSWATVVAELVMLVHLIVLTRNNVNFQGVITGVLQMSGGAFVSLAIGFICPVVWPVKIIIAALAYAIAIYGLKIFPNDEWGADCFKIFSKRK